MVVEQLKKYYDKEQKAFIVTKKDKFWLQVLLHRYQKLVDSNQKKWEDLEKDMEE